MAIEIVFDVCDELQVDFVLVVSKATSLASSSRNEGDDAGTEAPECCNGAALALVVVLKSPASRSALPTWREPSWPRPRGRVAVRW
jgi:hypothetical protein